MINEIHYAIYIIDKLINNGKDEEPNCDFDNGWESALKTLKLIEQEKLMELLK